MTTNQPQSEDDRFRTEIFERFMRLMPGHDLTLILLKGHLLVEEQMNKFIQASLGDAREAFLTLKLSFGRKLEFARQLHRPREPFAPVWNAVKELNELRTKIAHNPEIPDLAQRCDDFVKNRGHQSWEHLAADPHIRLSLAIGDIVAAVAGLRFGREKVMSKSRETQ